MGIWEIILIGISLSMDAFALSMCTGLGMRRFSMKHALLTALFFGGSQALMPAAGWLVGRIFAGYVDKYDHFIAFAVLAFLGVKMLVDLFRGDEGSESLTDLRSTFVIAFATSVDTLAVGVAFGADSSVRILRAACTIGLTTFVICISGVIIGSIFGTRFQKQAQFVGGTMLILVGMKILFEGLGIMELPI